MTKLLFSFKGNRYERELPSDLTVGSIKAQIVAGTSSFEDDLAVDDLRVLFKGKVLADDTETVRGVIAAVEKSSIPKKSKYSLLVMGTSSEKRNEVDEAMKLGIQQHTRLIRDDLTEQGQAREYQRKLRGRQMLQKASTNNSNGRTTNSTQYRFGSVEVLPNLPHQDKAREILTTLANDPGILACMAKNKWQVGSLAELYPDGNVGQSAVCVMGLNRNKGQQILLRIRTDDLSGFRKPLSIRKVLYHELAHNVHSDHDSQFFQLMRQIERECNELDWTKGNGVSGVSSSSLTIESPSYQGGTYRLGGNTTRGFSDANMNAGGNRASRELAAQAAMARMTPEEKEIEQNCGCGLQRQNLFLPSSLNHSSHNSMGTETTGSNVDSNPDQMD